MNYTKIPWTRGPNGERGYSWNPTSGCSLGCHYCYMAAMDKRFGKSFAPTCHPEKLGEPLKLKKPARIFVDSAGDLFDPAIPDGFIWQAFNEMRRAHWHTFLVLTKRAERMQRWFDSVRRDVLSPTSDIPWPLPNVHLGVTVEHQAAADERIPLLLETPAAVRFLSVEPLLNTVDLSRYLSCEFYAGPMIEPRKGTIGGTAMPAARIRPRLDWVIIGNDSRPGAKLPDPAWVERIIEQCRAAGVAVWIKGALKERWNFHEYPNV